jgi:hypothetical protein
MERRELESAAANYSYLRGLLSIPLGVVLIVAALGNWQWGPLRHAWVFVGCVLAAGGACLVIVRHYNENYGRITPSRRQAVRAVVAGAIGLAVQGGVTFLARSEVDWSLDLPVNSTAAGIAAFMLTYYAIAVGLSAHHMIIWGAVLVAGLCPVWDGADPSNIGLVIAGVAAMATGIFDHRLLVRTIGPTKGLNLERGNA